MKKTVKLLISIFQPTSYRLYSIPEIMKEPLALPLFPSIAAFHLNWKDWCSRNHLYKIFLISISIHHRSYNFYRKNLITNYVNRSCKSYMSTRISNSKKMEIFSLVELKKTGSYDCTEKNSRYLGELFNPAKFDPP